MPIPKFQINSFMLMFILDKGLEGVKIRVGLVTFVKKFLKVLIQEQKLICLEIMEFKLRGSNFLGVIDTYMADMMGEVIKEVGEQNMNICTIKNNEKNEVACSENSWITEVVDDVSFVRNFIMTHSMRLSIFNYLSPLKSLLLWKPSLLLS
ncbi:hypothetical protein CR513_13668, partial [Mucuna pruriens]